MIEAIMRIMTGKSRAGAPPQLITAPLPSHFSHALSPVYTRLIVSANLVKGKSGPIVVRAPARGDVESFGSRVAQGLTAGAGRRNPSRPRAPVAPVFSPSRLTRAFSLSNVWRRKRSVNRNLGAKEDPARRRSMPAG